MAAVFWRHDRWYLQYRNSPGQTPVYVREAGQKGWSKQRALDEAFARERAARGGEVVLRRTGSETVGTLCRWWLDTWCPAASKYHEESRLRTHVFSHPIAAVPVSQATAAVIERRLREMEASGASSTSVEQLRRILRAVFNRAMRDRKCDRNPANEVPKRKKSNSHEYITLSESEFVCLLTRDAFPDAWKLNFVAMALYTGARKGELLGLKKSDIDLRAKTITFRRSHGRNTTKGGHVDTIPIAAALEPYLVDALARAGASEYVLPAPGGGRRPSHTQAEVIVREGLKRVGLLVERYDHVCRRCKRRGAPHIEVRTTADYGLACPVCGARLWPKPVMRRFRFHDLRHTTATQLLRAGAPIGHVSRILRHRDISTTWNIYGHLVADDLRSAMEKLPSVPGFGGMRQGEAP